MEENRRLGVESSVGVTRALSLTGGGGGGRTQETIPKLVDDVLQRLDDRVGAGGRRRITVGRRNLNGCSDIWLPTNN